MHTIAPYFGYLASLMLIISLLVKNDIKFRWFNAAGSTAFIIYGILLNAIPVLLTNLILLTINLYYLIGMYRRKESFDLIEFTGEEKIINKLISYHQKDIALYFPEFNKETFNGNLSFVVLRDLVIANIFCAAVNETGDAEVLINYTLPKYRDYKVGRFIFEKEKQFLLSKGVKRIVYKKIAHPGHLAFLKVMGFTTEQDGLKKLYSKTLL